MTEISMTTFVDFVLSNGPPRLTVVRRAMHSAELGYHPSADFYKIFRDEVVRTHQSGSNLGELDLVTTKIHSPQKLTLYPKLIYAYKHWIGRHKTSWDQVWFTRWVSGNLVVRVNPELGLKIDGRPHIIKLYLKTDRPSKPRLDVIVHLLKKSFPSAEPSTVFGVLDVHRSHLYHETVPIAGLDALLAGEAAAFQRMWEAL